MKTLVYQKIFIILVLFLIGCTSNARENEAAPPNGIENNVQPFEGIYSADLITDFEETKISSFIPDGIDEVPGAGKGYWLVPNDEFIQLYNEELMAMWNAIMGSYGPCDELAIHVKFEGVLSEPATDGSGYGYMSQYEREVIVTRVLEIKYFWVSGDLCHPTLSTSTAQTATSTPTPDTTMP
jgi:hypothetical protein